MDKWIRVKISDLGQVVGGATPSTKKEEYYNGDIAWITPKDLSDFKGRYISRGERNITKAGMESCSTQLLPKNTILFSSRAPIGYVAIAENEMCTNQGFKSVIPNENVDYLFLYYLLKYNKDKIESMGSGTTFKEVSGSTMRNIEIMIPESVDTQRKIASVLDSIDSKIENNQKINNNLEQQISSIYEYLFEGQSWVTCELEDLIEVKDGTHDSPKPQTDGYLLVTSKHLLPYGVDRITPNRIAEKDFRKINERSLVEYGDILMSMIGTIGLISFVTDQTIDYAIKNVALFKTSQTPDLAYYFLSFLKSKKTQQYIEMCLAGSTQKYISLGELRKIPLPNPEGATLAHFNGVVKPMYQTIILNSKENINLSMLRDMLLVKLISGELDVSEIVI